MMAFLLFKETSLANRENGREETQKANSVIDDSSMWVHRYLY